MIRTCLWSLALLLGTIAGFGGKWLDFGVGRVLEVLFALPGLLLALVFIAVGPALLAYRTWGAGVQRAGPTVAAFFVNLTPLFAALMSAVFLGQAAQAYHAVAFLLIAGGILISTRRA